VGSICCFFELYRIHQSLHSISRNSVTGDFAMTITRRDVLLGATATAALVPLAARAHRPRKS
jgi:branched-chain amino acid transport system substrate-binding protein